MAHCQFLIRLAALASLVGSISATAAGCGSDGNRGAAQGDASYVLTSADSESNDSPGGNGDSASNVASGGDGAFDGSPSTATDAASEGRALGDGKVGADATSCGECIRAVECVEHCGGPVLVASCCPCPAGTSDRLLFCRSAGDGGSEASPSDGGDADDGTSGQDVAASSHPFPCGPLACTSDQQFCSIVNGHLPGQAATHDCVFAEGGPPSCGGPNSAASAGMCGCYASPNGEVTTTLCPP